jgi:hypothetical protein
MPASSGVYVLSDRRIPALTELARKRAWSGIKVTTSLEVGDRSFAAQVDVTGAANRRPETRVGRSHRSGLEHRFESSGVSDEAQENFCLRLRS